MANVEKYSRSQLASIASQAEKKRQELYDYIAQCTASEVIKDALRNQADIFTDIIQSCNQRLQHLYSSCLFCRERIEVEYPTKAHICKTCDDKTMGRL